MAVHFPVGIQARFEGSPTAGGKGRINGDEKMIQLSIQIHPHRSPQLDLTSLRAECERYVKASTAGMITCCFTITTLN